jgi:outer membrane biosynthesis protein TonB
MLRRTIGMLLLTVSSLAVAQTQAVQGIPSLVSGGIPRYPPIARAAQLSGTVKVRVTDESGDVTKLDVLDAKGVAGSRALEHGSALLTDPTLSNLRSWHFDPAVNDSFVVTYTYVLASVGSSDNPKVEISPSLDVTITTEPLRLDSETP